MKQAIGILFFFLSGNVFVIKAQSGNETGIYSYFSQVVLNVDTLSFTSKSDIYLIKNESYLLFEYKEESAIVELKLYPNESILRNKKISIVSSPDFTQLDSLTFVNNQYYTTRLRFSSISQSDFLYIRFLIQEIGKQTITDLKIFPFHNTIASISVKDDELFIGEEKQFEIFTNNRNNIVYTNGWKKQEDFEYRIYDRNGTPTIAIVPLNLGNKNFLLNVETKKPHFDKTKKPVYYTSLLKYSFSVKSSRLSFLKMDKRELVRDNNFLDGIEIQIDNHRNLQIHKTYRIEDREEGGGPLIAELYTVRKLSNDRVLCLIRPYQLHFAKNGYLFIKDGDQPVFVTNVDILPETKISKISILREGKNWTSDLHVFPGETIEIRLEGEALSRAKFQLEDISYMVLDTVSSSDKNQNFKVKIPVDVKKRSLDLYQSTRKTGFYISIQEYQRPKELDFVLVDYGAGKKPASMLNQAVLFSSTVKDIVLSFDPSKIEDAHFLYGKQFLEVDIRITGRRDELIEFQKIEYIEICPGNTSPRVAFYESSSCNKQDISINAILSRKTFSLDHWSKIELVIRHKKDKYGGQGFTQKIEIFLQKSVLFDVDVSFPAGLVIKKVGVDGFPGLGGISLAMLAQFSFYEKNKIKRLKPYKVGAGFLAQNAFNFNPDAQDRDLGIVVLGSVYPTRKDSKLSFPLYAGFGYFLNQDKFFYLIGPGIRVSL
jgi:hypothetical protein